MKQLLISLTILFSSGLLFSQPAFNEPDLVVDKEVHDFGNIEKGSDGNCTFTVTNNGDQPLIISKCEKTCGCTIPTCDHKPILPAETSEIHVSYDTNRIGPFNKSVKIHSNDPDEALKILRIEGTVVLASVTE